VGWISPVEVGPLGSVAEEHPESKELVGKRIIPESSAGMAAQLPWDVFQLVRGIPQNQCQAELDTVGIHKKPMHYEQRVVCLEDNCFLRGVSRKDPTWWP
jgi:hypothetical protein